MSQSQDDRTAGVSAGQPVFDTSEANPARIWNYWLGGKDHFEADREAAEKVIEVMPSMPLLARLARRQLIDTVRLLAGTYGIRQFLDIGSGLPSADNTHEVAQRTAPRARVVYVDNDPVVICHARALLTSGPEGATDYIQADLRDTAAILAGAARTLDFRQPVAVLLMGVLHFIPDEDGPARDRGPADGRHGPRKLPGHRARGQRHPGGRGAGGDAALQRAVVRAAHAENPGAGGAVLRRAGTRRPGGGPAQPVVACGRG